MKTLSANKLFTLVQVGPMELKHRVVMAPAQGPFSQGLFRVT
jgi:2,4-dienoyl-CoA reductase-like NADH-dependent reductase (Old Yellow Enzyme family)